MFPTQDDIERENLLFEQMNTIRETWEQQKRLFFRGNEGNLDPTFIGFLQSFYYAGFSNAIRMAARKFEQSASNDGYRFVMHTLAEEVIDFVRESPFCNAFESPVPISRKKEEGK